MKPPDRDPVEHTYKKIAWRYARGLFAFIRQCNAQSLVQEGHDDLKWCGSAPFYTFLKTMPECRGELLDYHQWQIDPHSVVSFGALRFY